MSEPINFSKAQDMILLQEAVAVRPFSQGKGLGWKMIASKLTKFSQFPTALKAKIVRERILQLMDDYTQRSTEELCDSLDDDEEQLSMDQNLQQLVNLRNEAVKMATQNRSANSIEIEKESEKESGEVSPKMELDQVQTSKVVEEKDSNKQQSQPATSRLQCSKGPAKGKRKMTPAPPKQRQSKAAKDNLIYKFLEEREAKRLKLREEELALRREELEERKKLLHMVEQRLEEEKTIRENIFNLMSKVVNKNP